MSNAAPKGGGGRAGVEAEGRNVGPTDAARGRCITHIAKFEG